MLKLSIFVSSKTDELREERKRIKSVFSSELFDVFVFEQAGARTEAAEEVYREEVLNCDIYVGIFKEKYSWATEEEYKLASQSQKVIHVYVADNVIRDPKLDRLLLKMRRRHKYQTYENIDNLLQYVWCDIEELRNRVFKKAKSYKYPSVINSGVEDIKPYDFGIPEISQSLGFSKPPEAINRALNDISIEDIGSSIKTVVTSTNNDVKEEVWKHLIELAKNDRIWKYARIWNLLDREILVSVPGRFFNNAVIILKWILQNAENDIRPYPNPVSLKARKLYLNKSKEILGSVDLVWDFYHRDDFNQILKYITQEDERCKIWWDAWKKCAKGIEDDDQYRRSTFSLDHDLVNSNSICRDSIRQERWTLIESTEPSYLAQRAKNLHI